MSMDVALLNAKFNPALSISTLAASFNSEHLTCSHLLDSTTYYFWVPSYVFHSLLIISLQCCNCLRAQFWTTPSFFYTLSQYIVLNACSSQFCVCETDLPPSILNVNIIWIASRYLKFNKSSPPKENHISFSTSCSPALPPFPSLSLSSCHYFIQSSSLANPEDL